VIGAYCVGYVLTFLLAGPSLCARLGLQHEALPVRVITAALFSLFWPFLLAGSLIRRRRRARRARACPDREPAQELWRR